MAIVWISCTHAGEARSNRTRRILCSNSKLFCSGLLDPTTESLPESQPKRENVKALKLSLASRLALLYRKLNACFFLRPKGKKLNISDENAQYQDFAHSSYRFFIRYPFCEKVLFTKTHWESRIRLLTRRWQVILSYQYLIRIALAQNIRNHMKFISRTDSEVSIAALYSILNTLGWIQSIQYIVHYSSRLAFR